MFAGVVAEGPTTDQNMLQVYGTALAESVKRSVAPFVSWSIAYQTFLDIKPDRNGISKNRYKIQIGKHPIYWGKDKRKSFGYL